MSRARRIDYTPCTRTVLAATIKPGHIVLERAEHPAQVVRVGRAVAGPTFHCRYVWQASSEPTWPIGPFRPTTPIEKAVSRNWRTSWRFDRQRGRVFVVRWRDCGFK